MVNVAIKKKRGYIMKSQKQHMLISLRKRKIFTLFNKCFS